MGYLIGMFFIVSGCFTKDTTHFLVAGLFWIAGSISLHK